MRAAIRRTAAELARVVVPRLRQGSRPVQGAELYVDGRLGRTVALHADGTVIDLETLNRVPTTAGDLLAFNGVEWVRVAIGASNQVLVVNTARPGKWAWSNTVGPAFSGVLSKDVNPGSQAYSPGLTTLGTYDTGAGGSVLPMALQLPATISASIKTVCRLELSDMSVIDIENTAIGATLTYTVDQLALAIMGALSGPGTKNGLRVRIVQFIVNNTSGGDVTVDLGAFRIRAYVTPAGGGTAL